VAVPVDFPAAIPAPLAAKVPDMSPSHLAFLPITRLSGMLDARSVTATELTRLAIARAEGPGKALNCCLAVLSASALAEAEAADRRAGAGRRLGPLDGIPVALKDNIDVAGAPTTAGLGGSGHRVPDEDAEVVRRLRAAGAVILAKLNMQEAALGATNDNPHHGQAINPHRAGCSPGGSSGGSAAAVAAGICAAALGTDTGGSVRIPASYCGVVGLKASFGLISTRGVVPLSYQFDHVGPLTRTVGDAALLLSVLQGFDPRCTESRRRSGWSGDLVPGGRLDGVRVGVIRTFDQEPPEPAVAEAFRAALARLEGLGAVLHPVDMPDYDMVAGRRAGFLRVEVEAAHIFAAVLRDAPERLSPELRGYLEFGTRATAQQLMRADRRIAEAAFAFERCFDEVDLLVSPTVPQAGLVFGNTPPENAGTYTIPANFAGTPAISVPMGRDPDGLPLGLQIMAAADREGPMLMAAAAFEASAGLDMTPPEARGAGG